jgi:hypothetical protein
MIQSNPTLETATEIPVEHVADAALRLRQTVDPALVRA